MTDMTVKTPWHLWAVGVIAVLWNAYGGYDYTMSMTQGAAYMATAGMTPDQIAYYEAMLVQSKGRQIHLVVDSVKYGFQDWDSVVALGFDTKHIRHVSHPYLDHCKTHAKLLTPNDTAFSRASLKAKMTTALKGWP